MPTDMPNENQSYGRMQKPQALKILKAAQRLLISKGYPLFSIRNVAKTAGLSVGAVQYHFKTREVLLEEMLLFVAEQYERQYSKVYAQSYDSAEDRFFGMIDFYIEDLAKPARRSFFAQAWALAQTEEYAAQSMERSFARYRNAVARSVGELVDGLSDVECSLRAAAIQSLIEGAQLSQVKRGQHFVLQARVKTLVREQAYAIAMQHP